MKNAFIVSSDSENSRLLTHLAQSNGYDKISVFSSAGHFRRNALFSNADIVIIDSPLSDEFGGELAENISEAMNCGILFISRTFIAHNMIHRLEPYGVVFLSRPFTNEAFRKAVNTVSENCARMAGNIRENSSLLAKIDEMRLINRAKRALMQYLDFTETQAHKYIEKQAMNNRLTRCEVALKILASYEK